MEISCVWESIQGMYHAQCSVLIPGTCLWQCWGWDTREDGPLVWPSMVICMFSLTPSQGRKPVKVSSRYPPFSKVLENLSFSNLLSPFCPDPYFNNCAYLLLIFLLRSLAWFLSSYPLLCQNSDSAGLEVKKDPCKGHWVQVKKFTSTDCFRVYALLESPTSSAIKHHSNHNIIFIIMMGSAHWHCVKVHLVSERTSCKWMMYLLQHPQGATRQSPVYKYNMELCQ